jgi:hypothetical protein
MGKKWGKPNERPESRPKAFASGWSAQEKDLPTASSGRADEANWGGHKYDQKEKGPWD